MRSISFTLPDDLTLCSLEEARGMWVAYLKASRFGHLRQGVSTTPQRAIDAAERALRADLELRSPVPVPALSLADLGIKL